MTVRQIALPVLLVAVLAVLPFFASGTLLNFLVSALIIALGAQGWNLLAGFGGQLSFGHAAFFGTGPMSPRSCRSASASMPGPAWRRALQSALPWAGSSASSASARACAAPTSRW
ncbi:hypothetical protein ACFQU7_33900 [Pseudoroseomonas wenyumeiae]